MYFLTNIISDIFKILLDHFFFHPQQIDGKKDLYVSVTMKRMMMMCELKC